MINKILQLLMLITVLTTSTFADKASSDDKIKKMENDLAKEKLIKSFSTNIKSEKWNKFLEICSTRVKKSCQDSQNKKEFFHSVLPIEAIKRTKNFRRSSQYTHSFLNGISKSERYETISVKLSNKECSYSLSWEAKLQEEDGVWVIDFSTSPSSKQIQQLQSKGKK